MAPRLFRDGGPRVPQPIPAPTSFLSINDAVTTLELDSEHGSARFSPKTTESRLSPDNQAKQATAPESAGEVRGSTSHAVVPEGRRTSNLLSIGGLTASFAAGHHTSASSSFVTGGGSNVQTGASAGIASRSSRLSRQSRRLETGSSGILYHARSSLSALSGFSFVSPKHTHTSSLTWLHSGSLRSSKIVEDGIQYSSEVQSPELMDRRQRNSVVERTGSLTTFYEVQEELGRGGFGIVVKAKELETGNIFAVKSLTIEKESQRKYVEAELDIGRRLAHPNIISMHEALRDDTGILPKCHFVMTYCTGGTLHDKVDDYFASRRSEESNGKEPEQLNGLPTSLAAKYIWQMLAAIAYLHYHRVVHRDIKAENFLLEQANDSAALRLVDFGLSKSMIGARRLVSRVGTPYTCAPEIYEGSYDEKCDVWSVGIVCYMLFLGWPPWIGETPDQTETMVQTMDIDWDEEESWRWHPKEAQELCQDLLVRNPMLRPKAKDILSTNDWLQHLAGVEVNRRRQGGCCTIS